MIRRRWCVLCAWASTWPHQERRVGLLGWTPRSQVDRMNPRMLGSLTWPLGASEWSMKTSKIQVDYNHCVITWLAMLKSARIMVKAFYSFKNDLPDANAVSLPPSSMTGKNLQMPSLLTSRYLREALTLLVFNPNCSKINGKKEVVMSLLLYSYSPSILD